MTLLCTSSPSTMTVASLPPRRKLRPVSRARVRTTSRTFPFHPSPKSPYTPSRLSNRSFSHHHHSRFLLPEPSPLPILSPTPTNPLSGVLELTHNHGTESDPNFKGYVSGNSDPGRGFGHIAVSVPDIEKACARLEGMGVPFKKRLTDGTMRNIAFALDPDG